MRTKVKSSQGKLNFDPQPIFCKAAPRDYVFFLAAFTLILSQQLVLLRHAGGIDSWLMTQHSLETAIRSSLLTGYLLAPHYWKVILSFGNCSLLFFSNENTILFYSHLNWQHNCPQNVFHKEQSRCFTAIITDTLQIFLRQIFSSPYGKKMLEENFH